MEQSFMKRWHLTVLVLIISAAVLVPLLWFINVYSEIYPSSYEIQVQRPFVGKVYENAIDYKSACKVIYWKFDAKVNIKSWAPLRQYYIDRWEQEPFPMGSQVGGVGDSFTMLKLDNKSYSISILKTLLYKGEEINPVHYGILTELDYCKFGN